jgi:hypothetical protein
MQQSIHIDLLAQEVAATPGEGIAASDRVVPCDGIAGDLLRCARAQLIDTSPMFAPARTAETAQATASPNVLCGCKPMSTVGSW